MEESESHARLLRISNALGMLPPCDEREFAFIKSQGLQVFYAFFDKILVAQTITHGAAVLIDIESVHTGCNIAFSHRDSFIGGA